MPPSTGALVLLVYFLRKALLYIAYGTITFTVTVRFCRACTPFHGGTRFARLLFTKGIAYGTVISTYNNGLTLYCGASFLFIAVDGKGTASHIAIFGLTSLYYGDIILYVFDMGSNVPQIPTTKEVL